MHNNYVYFLEIYFYISLTFKFHVTSEVPCPGCLEIVFVVIKQGMQYGQGTEIRSNPVCMSCPATTLQHICRQECSMLFFTTHWP
jgi:hypothetical protein